MIQVVFVCVYVCVCGGVFIIIKLPPHIIIKIFNGLGGVVFLFKCVFFRIQNSYLILKQKI